MHPDLLTLCRQRITIEPYLESDSFGAPAYGPAAEYPARVKGETRMVRVPTGEERVSSVVAVVPGPPEGPGTIDPRSRITLPEEFTPPDGTSRPLLAAGSFPDESGEIHHHTLRFE